LGVKLNSLSLGKFSGAVKKITPNLCPGFHFGWKVDYLPVPNSERAMVPSCFSACGVRLVKQHRDVVPGVFAAGAADDDAVAGNPAAVNRRLERDGHLGPFVKRRGAAKLDAAFVDGNFFGTKRQR
jgi:hypothetical protein